MSKLIRRLGQLAGAAPGRGAIVGTEIELSWAGLLAAVEELAGQLSSTRSLGLHLANSPAWIVADLAGIGAHLQVIPLPTFFSQGQMRHALADGNVDTVITDDPGPFREICSVRWQQAIRVAGTELTLLRLADAADIALPGHKVTYTSGTTGDPKGVVLPVGHIETVAESLHEASAATEDDRALVLFPLATLLENIGSVYVPILAGARIVVPNPSETGLRGSSGIDVELFARMLARHRPTTMILPPQLLKLVIGLASRNRLPDSFRYIAVGGAPVGKGLMERAKRLGLPVSQGYGLSEACSVVAVNTLGDNRHGSVGKPLPHARVRISPDGEILVGGTVFRGYLNQGGGCVGEVATGDLGYLDEQGYLFVTGRRKDVIITGYGRNISPEWIESECQAHPAIAQAAIFGDGEPFLTAVLTPQPMSAGSSRNYVGQLADALSEVNRSLPDYAQVARFVVSKQPFSTVTQELTANGRPRREIIGERYARQLRQVYEQRHEHIF